MQATVFWMISKPSTLIKYGLLYNWYAATDVRNICSAGWHIPTEVELDELGAYLGGDSIAGGKLKDTGLTYWNPTNIGATNEAGFNGRGAGYRSEVTGLFASLGAFMYFWSSDGWGTGGNRRWLQSVDAKLWGNGSGSDKKMGASIRPIKDSTTLTNGQTGTYTGNDGKVYRTICIGTQEWLADNLCETKFRDGSTIPNVTDNATWGALVTGALCAYDNDDNNV